LIDERQEKMWVRIVKVGMGLYTFAAQRLTEIYVNVKPVNDDVRAIIPNQTTNSNANCDPR